MKLYTKSFLRIEEYIALSKLIINGLILDVGGSKRSGYHELIKGEHKIITGNIDESYDIDVKFDAQSKWPFCDSNFDGVLMVNILEHLISYENAVSEGFRVLKNKGVIAGVVPFMFNIHASPNDYFRYTKPALQNIFTKAGFSQVVVEELGSGGWSVIYHVLIGFIRWNWLAYILMKCAYYLDKATKIIRPNNKMDKIHMPLGYFFLATK